MKGYKTTILNIGVGFILTIYLCTVNSCKQRISENCMFFILLLIFVSSTILGMQSANRHWLHCLGYTSVNAGLNPLFSPNNTTPEITCEIMYKLSQKDQCALKRTCTYLSKFPIRVADLKGPRVPKKQTTVADCVAGLRGGERRSSDR